MDAVTSIVLSGLVLGSLYALIASGLALIWSTLNVFNFAHSGFMVVSAYLAWSVIANAGIPVLPGVVLTLLAVAVLSVVFGLVFVRPMLGRPQGDLLVMVTTLAATTIATNGAQLIWGAQIKQLPTLIDANLRIGATNVGGNQIAAIVLAPVVVGGTIAFVRHSRLGLAIRSVEQNRDFAQLVGVRPDRIYLLTIAMASCLAGLAGILLGGITFITPTMGDDPLLKAFVVVVFGGLASMTGSLVGGYVVGFIEAISAYVLGLFWTPVVIFLAMILIMLVRPQGLVVRKAGV
jgi:branched-chain amino acid transport system permease protein